MIEKVLSALKNKTVRDRLLFTLSILLIIRIGSTIPIPRVNILKGEGSQSGYFELLSLLGGGGIENFSIFALGVSPYLTSSIIISLLSMESVLPRLADLQKKGESGRKLIENATRYLTLLIAAVQAYTILLNAQSSGLIAEGSLSSVDYIYITIVLVAGTFFTIWLADRISSRGVGNGVSMIIFAGIVYSMPVKFAGAFNELVTFTSTPNDILSGMMKYSVFIIAYLAVVVFVVFLEKAQRKLPVQYSTSSGQQREITFLPLKINSAGVMPVIFASTILMAPQTIASFLMNGKTPTPGSFAESMIKVTTLGQTYNGYHWSLTIYLILVFVFTFIYASMQVNPEQISENLQKSAGYIPGIRPGNETTRYVKKVLNRITFLGAVALVIIAALPIVIPMMFNLNSSLFAIGGTGLIIVVGVAIETTTQINGYLTGNKYQGFMDY